MGSENTNGLPRSSDLGVGFGYVTPEDRAKWDQARSDRARNQHRSAASEFVKSSMSAMSELNREGIQASLRAAHQVAAQEERKRDTETRRTIVQVETVDILERDSRTPIDTVPDFS